MHEAVNYIKDLQNKIQELSEKREELRRLSDTPTCSSGSECSQSHPEDSITVRPCLGGVEVAVSTAFKNGLPISRVLKLLNREGLSIVNCISTRMNETLLHNIISEVMLYYESIRVLQEGLLLDYEKQYDLISEVSYTGE